MSASGSDTTRFGSLWSSPQVSCGLLRATASRHGMELAPIAVVPDEDLAAAVVAADAWMCALRADNMECPSRFGLDAVVVLSAILARAAGAHTTDDYCMEEGEKEQLLTSLPDSWFIATEDWLRHVSAWGLDTATVFAKAAADMARGSSRLQAMASLLQESSGQQ